MRSHLLLLIGWTRTSHAWESGGIQTAAPASQHMETLASFLLMSPKPTRYGTNERRSLGRGGASHRITTMSDKQFSPPVPGRRSLSDIIMREDASVTSAKEESAQQLETSSDAPSSSSSSSPLMPPVDYGDMMRQATAAIKRATIDGKNRLVVRLLIPRDGELVPPDESWEGGIMQLYGRVSPMTSDLLKKAVGDIGGVAPKVKEQRIDGPLYVDGRSIWVAEGATPADDMIAMVHPDKAYPEEIKKYSDQAKERTVVLVNPQWPTFDDPLDYLSKQGGFMGAIGNALGGKQAFEAELEKLGYFDAYRIDQYVTRGSRVCLLKVYPYAWNAYVFNKGAIVPILTNLPSRPKIAEVEQALIDNDVPFKFTEFDDVL